MLLPYKYKRQIVVALWLMEFATYLIDIGLWYCLCYIYMWLMLLPQWQMELPHVNQGDGWVVNFDGWQME